MFETVSKRAMLHIIGGDGNQGGQRGRDNQGPRGNQRGHGNRRGHGNQGGQGDHGNERGGTYAQSQILAAVPPPFFFAIVIGSQHLGCRVPTKTRVESV